MTSNEVAWIHGTKTCVEINQMYWSFYKSLHLLSWAGIKLCVWIWKTRAVLSALRLTSRGAPMVPYCSIHQFTITMAQANLQRSISYDIRKRFFLFSMQTTVPLCFWMLAWSFIITWAHLDPIHSSIKAMELIEAVILFFPIVEQTNLYHLMTDPLLTRQFIAECLLLSWVLYK